MDKCQSYIERQQYGLALPLLAERIEKDECKPDLETIYLLNSILSLTPNYKKLQIHLLKLITLEDDNYHIYCSLFLQLISLYIEIDALSEAKKALDSLARISNEQDLRSPALDFILQQITNMIVKSEEKRLIDDHKQEAEEFERLRQLEEHHKYFQTDGLFAYLIPTTWFRKWRNFVTPNQDTLPVEDPLANLDHEPILRLHSLFRLAQETDIEDDVCHPGPIDGTKLIDFKLNLFVDQYSPKHYTNYVLKENLREGQDFIMVGYQSYNYLASIYGSFEVKRLIIERPADKRKCVDLLPRVLTFILFPSSNHEPQVIPANTYDSILDFSKRIKRNLRKHDHQYDGFADGDLKNFIRWWRFKDLSVQQTWISRLRQGNLIKSIQATLQEDRTITEDLNISENDVFICEIRKEKNWTLTEDNRPNSQAQRSLNQILNSYQISSPPRLLSDSRRGLTGLQNLGNTCFMNAALQCLSNTYELTEFMVSNAFVNDFNPHNPLGTKGQLAVYYAELMKTMWFGNYGAVSAYELKKTIGKFAPQFYGYGQQDSHEFLSYLLDGLHEDLNRVQHKPLVEELEITNETDQQAAQKFWLNYLLRNQSKVQELMVGQYKSTLLCPKCNRRSVTFDPFISLSLPIPQFEMLQLSLYFIYEDTEKLPIKCMLPLSSDMQASEIVSQLSSIVNIDSSRMNLVLAKDHQVRERVKKTQNVKSIHDHEGVLFVQEVSKEFYQLEADDVHVDFYYTLKGTKIYETDKVVSFPRQMVLRKRDTINDLYVAVYKRFRTHLFLALKELKDQDFPMKEFKELEKPETDERYLQELRVLADGNKLPFTLRVRGKAKPQEVRFEDQGNLETFGSLLTVDVYINETYLRNVQLLKLQRCKELSDTKGVVKMQKKGEYSLEDCLRAFSKHEILGKGDEWYCNKCKLHVQASKKMEIYKAPQILIVHLKRFKTNKINNFGNYYFSGGSQKITALVRFPSELDLNGQILSRRDNDQTDYTYSLYGVVNHYGGMGGGHYTASAFNPILQKWIEFNDSSARVTNPDVVSEAGYVLFYRRKDCQKAQIFS